MEFVPLFFARLIVHYAREEDFFICTRVRLSIYSTVIFAFGFGAVSLCARHTDDKYLLFLSSTAERIFFISI